MLLQSWLANWRRNAGRLVETLRGNRRARRSSVVPASPETLELRCLLTTATIDLGSLAPNGVTLNGVDTGDRTGWSVSGIGDLNGDGYDDVLIGALNTSGAGNAAGATGEAYVVFGKADWSATPAVELSSLNGTTGFVLYGVDGSDFAGGSVSAAGDVNADGYADLLIGAYFGDGVGNAKSNSGETYLIFGKSSWTAVLNLGTLNGTNGVTFYGVDASDQSGKAVSAAGDVNGDGYADILIGAGGGDGAGNSKDASGECYVVFGKEDWSATATMSLGSLNGTNGFTLYGATPEDGAGKAVGSAGDVNGDGFADVIIGAPDADAPGMVATLSGRTYVVFGKANWSGTATLSLGSLNGTNGFTLNGIDTEDGSGAAVGGAGDVNGDGFDDVIIGAPGAAGIDNVVDSIIGESYVVFGKANWSATASVNLSSLNGTTGFTVYGVTMNDSLGTRVDGIGDLNADGYDDVLISGLFAAGLNPESTGNGQTYVVYGKAVWSATATLIGSALDGTNGFIVYGAAANDQSGKSANGAGDFNGDGFPDIVIGAPNVIIGEKDHLGQGYVVFGGDFTSSATQVGTAISETLTGTAGVDKLVGGGGNDMLVGEGGADVAVHFR